MSKPVVYVAGPYRSDLEYQVLHNILLARREAAAVWKAGGIAICPHLNTAMMGGMMPDEVWLEGDLELIRRSDAVYAFAVSCPAKQGVRISSGVAAEVAFAQGLKIPVFTTLESVAKFIAGWKKEAK